MNPISINVNVTVRLDESTIRALGVLLNISPSDRQALEEKPKEEAPIKTEKAAPVKTEALNEAAVSTAAPAPEKAEEISDEQLRQVIKSVRDKSTPAAVREIFAEFGIKTSIECPQERRPELVARLNKLAS
jgi:hypothetical protein